MDGWEYMTTKDPRDAVLDPVEIWKALPPLTQAQLEAMGSVKQRILYNEMDISVSYL